MGSHLFNYLLCLFLFASADFSSYTTFFSSNLHRTLFLEFTPHSFPRILQKAVTEFRYLAQTGCYQANKDVNDAEVFARTVEALEQWESIPRSS